ncbi:MAG: phosphatase PAP2 family protein [Sphingobacteriaceae bacterium]
MMFGPLFSLRFFLHRVLLLPAILFLFMGLPKAQAQNWDIRVLNCINSPSEGDPDNGLKYLSDHAFIIDAGVPLGLIAAGYIKNDIDLRNKGLAIAASFVGNTLITTALKDLIKRPRPFETYPDLIYKKSNAGSYSFPSGHTSSVFSTATSLSLHFPKWYVIIPAYTYAVGVGYTRMDLGVHYPSDVIAGAIIGSGTAYLSWKINKALKRKHSTPKGA